MTAVDLDALDAARAAVPSGAWEVTDDEHHAGVHEYGIWSNDGEYGRYIVELIPSPADAALIVAMHTALPDLIADARKLRALREWLDKLIATAPAMWHGEYPVSAVAVSDLLGVLALAAALTSEGERE